ncbi:hypothetical protein IQ272_24990 [Chroococcidiopsidales cyanobacterium LEGE 13417]|nr:hypothetical protein [Chroococcidiopsidales cyanobacterium LEGE 13417]
MYVVSCWLTVINCQRSGSRESGVVVKIQITNDQLPITNYQLPITNSWY